jgi:nitrous oxide reductase accessory protein NosL
MRDEPAWPHQVVIRLTLADFREKLRDIEEWLRMWEIPYRIGATVGPAGAVRICFAEEKFARAFVFNKGGTMALAEDIETAMLEDEADEAEYQRLTERMTKKD